MKDRRIYCGKWEELRIDQKRAEEDEAKIKNIVEVYIKKLKQYSEGQLR